jgi:NADH dehydrogenase FAD-containing subunit
MQTILILGGSYGGVSTAHRILKTSGKTADIKIILVTPNTHLYWNLAAVRGVLPGGFPDEKLFQEIAPGFKQYPAAKFELVLGSAEKLDPSAKTVIVNGKPISYDICILATGSNAGGLPFKGLTTFEETKKALHDLQNKIKAAESIIICGAGPTGVETTGELGYEYKKTKKITLVSFPSNIHEFMPNSTCVQIASGPTILEGTPLSVSKVAINTLRKLNVDIKLGTKVESSTVLPSGQTELTLSDGSKMTTDVYLPLIGLKPNSSYIPENLLNPKGFVVVDEYLRVKGAEGLWAVGDISAIQRPQYMNTEAQSVHLAKNIGLVLQKKQPLPYAIGGKGKPLLSPAAVSFGND